MGTHLKAVRAPGWSVGSFPLALHSNISRKFSTRVATLQHALMGKPGMKGYKEKREKNNEAVRKSREKKREKEKLTKAELERVREENRMMEEQIHRLESNIEILKGGAMMK